MDEESTYISSSSKPKNPSIHRRGKKRMMTDLDKDESDLLVSKIIVLILFGLLKFMAGLTPSILLKRLNVDGKRKRWLEKTMGGILCVGGGVLLATVFVHMLPEVRESINTAKKQFENTKDKDDHHDHEHRVDQHEPHGDDHEDEHGYPFAELITCAGFFVIYFIEAVVHRVFRGTHGSGSHGHSHGVPTDMIKDTNVIQEGDDASKESESTEHEKSAISELQSPSTDRGTDNQGLDVENEGLGNGDTKEMPTNATVGKEENAANKDKDVDEKMKNDKEKAMVFSVRNFLMVLALSVHGIFEGMALGLQLTVPDVWKLALALSLHEIPVLFCVGMEMFNVGLKRLHIIAYFLILGIISPIGIVIGIVLTQHAGEGNSGTQSLVIGLLQGLAGGTLLYIAFYEVLDREKLSKAGMTGILGCVLLTCGFAFMAALEAAGGHSHGVVEKDHADDVSHEGHNHG